MKQLFIMALLFLAGTTVAQSNEEIITGNGKTIKEKRQITEFTQLRVTGSFEVVLAPVNEITLEGSENVLKEIETQVTNGTLVVEARKGKKIKAGKITIKVPYYTSLNEIFLKGSGSVTAKNTIKNNLKLHLEGSGDIELNLNAAKAEACVLGSGSITLTGSADDFECKVIGSGNIEAKDLESANVNVVVSGSGNANIICNKAITGKISGSGNVAFAGNPKEQDLKRSGSGEYRAF